MPLYAVSFFPVSTTTWTNNATSGMDAILWDPLSTYWVTIAIVIGGVIAIGVLMKFIKQ